MAPPRPPAPSSGPDVLFRLLMGAVLITVPFSHLAWLGGNLASRLTGGPWAPYAPPTPCSARRSCGRPEPARPSPWAGGLHRPSW